MEGGVEGETRLGTVQRRLGVLDGLEEELWRHELRIVERAGRRRLCRRLSGSCARSARRLRDRRCGRRRRRWRRLRRSVAPAALLLRLLSRLDLGHGLEHAVPPRLKVGLDVACARGTL